MKRDLIIHVTDAQMEKGFRAFFARDNWHHAMGCRRFEIDSRSSTDIYRIGGETDGSLWKRAHENLIPFLPLYHHAVVVLDADFAPHPGADTLRQDIATNMIEAGWPEENFQVVVIEPELEAWLWAPVDQVATAFGQPDFASLRSFLTAAQLWPEGAAKPSLLKQATDKATRYGQKRVGGPIFENIFATLPKRALAQCTEVGFQSLRSALQRWFPLSDTYGS